MSGGCSRTGIEHDIRRRNRGDGLARSAKLKAAATILIVLGLAETAVLVCAIWYKFSFSGGSLFYCYAGYRLLKRSAATYKYVTRGLLVFLVLVTAGLLFIVALGVDVILADGISVELEEYGSWLILVPYFILVPLLTALLYHPDTRAEFGLAELGKSAWTLYLGRPRAPAVLTIGLVLAGVLLGPHLLANPFQAIANFVRSDDGVRQKIGRPLSLAFLAFGEYNWTFSSRVRAGGSRGTGLYYADLAPDGTVTLDAYGYEGVPLARLAPKAQAEPAVPEAFGDSASAGATVVLLSTSFESAPGGSETSVRPFVQSGKIAWGRDPRAHSGDAAINVIPEGNPGKLEYFGDSVNTALLSSQPGGRYVPFRVESFRSVELVFWRLSTSNPSTWHNCLGSLLVAYRLDGGEWKSKMAYCGFHKSSPPVWKHSRLGFDTRGHKELEIRFEYEYPPETRIDKTVVYLVDDLQVRGVR